MNKVKFATILVGLIGLNCFSSSACVTEAKTEYESETSRISEKLVYGDDDRIDYGTLDPTDQRRFWADSVGLLAESDGITCSDGSCAVDTRIFNLCPGQKFYFYGQKVATSGTCTAFLVGPKLFATAGHCISESECEDLVVAFGFTYAGSLNDVLPEEDVYSCTNIVVDSEWPDYALFEVDRYVTNRVPHWVRYVNKVPDLQPVTVIGHPSAMPIKIDSGGVVKINTQAAYYDENVDSFEGTSGAPSINNDTGVVEGIVSGQPERDYNWNNSGECLEVNTCSDSEGCDDGFFSITTRITELSDLIPLHPAGTMVVLNSVLTSI